MRTRWFSNETDALAFKKKQEDELGFNGTDFGTITDDERAGLALWRSFKAKSPTGPDLGVVIRKFTESWRQANQSITVADAFDKFIGRAEAERASPRHVASLKTRLGRLVTDHGDKLVATIDANVFSDWLDGLRGTRADKLGAPLGPITRDNLRKTCRGFFSYCGERGWIPDNPVGIVARKRTREHRLAARRAPEVMHPADVEKFLHKIEEVAAPILPLWALKFFAGVRDAEVMRLDWRMIDLEKQEINLPAAITKTGDARKVKIQPNLAAWLASYGKPAGPVAPSATTARYLYKKTLRHLRRPDKIGGKQKRGTPPKVFIFPSNAARHSFGTYHLFAFRDPGETALQLGHKSNPAMLWQAYANPAAEEHAGAFWEIQPANRKIISLGRRLA